MSTRQSRVARTLRRSLSLRVSVLVALAVAIAVGIMSAYVVNTIRDGLFNERVEDILVDASVRRATALAQLDSAIITTQDQAVNEGDKLVTLMEEPSAGIVQAQLIALDRGDFPIRLPDVLSNGAYDLAPSTELHAQLAASPEQLVYQSVVIRSTDPEVADVPGVLVGMQARVPSSGIFGLYLAYSLESEQESVNLMLRTLMVGTGVMALALALLIWIIMWRVLQPVREAAIAAERIAAGLLHERMDVRGVDELATLARSFNEMAESLQRQIEQLEDLSRFQQRFVSDVSHELRTPLTTIRMAADVINSARSGFDPVTRRSAELLYNQLDRFEAMLADLLEISRFDAGAAVLVPSEQDLRPIIESVVEYSQPLAEQKDSTIRLRGMGHAATAAIDGRRVERIIRNLVVNAIEHCNGRPIDVTLYDGDDAVALRVFDTGVGMSPQTAEHVFDRFWRADPARARTTGGTGLGLAISYEDARLHGGTLEAAGEEGVYACFLMTLPKAVNGSFTPPTTVIPPELAAIGVEA
ncbi:two-component system, OmpR family, sensor histidine kinase MtrB [Ruaniaceae bacterium KH17]|nr:two-component system, OmpR family, sensor histidine kinase MtrB [Ruaniaceae bacterium KH17]